MEEADDVCPVCLEKLRYCATGKSTTCLHEVCLQCMFEIADDRGSYKCPVCRKVSDSYYVDIYEDAIKFHRKDKEAEPEIIDLTEVSDNFLEYDEFQIMEEMLLESENTVTVDDEIEFNFEDDVDIALETAVQELLTEYNINE